MCITFCERLFQNIITTKMSFKMSVYDQQGISIDFKNFFRLLYKQTNKTITINMKTGKKKVTIALIHFGLKA